MERIRGHDAGELLAMAFHSLPESVARRPGWLSTSWGIPSTRCSAMSGWPTAKPVRDYGRVDPFEAFAEAFTAWVRLPSYQTQRDRLYRVALRWVLT